MRGAGGRLLTLRWGIDSSPQGRIFQVEYALEAIKQGSAAVGLVSNTHAVLVALKACAHYFISPGWWMSLLTCYHRGMQRSLGHIRRRL